MNPACLVPSSMVLVQSLPFWASVSASVKRTVGLGHRWSDSHTLQIQL